MGNSDLTKQYYKAWQDKDWNALEALLAGDFAFSSPNHDDHIGKDEYKTRCWVGVDSIDRYDIEKVVEQGDEVVAIARCWWKNGTNYRTADYFRFKNGQIQEIDSFWGFMPQDIQGMGDALQGETA